MNNVQGAQRPLVKGTSKVLPATVSLLKRPHTGLTLALGALVWSPLFIGNQTAVGVGGAVLSLVCLLFVGRDTDRCTARLERFNMLAFSVLFSLLALNVLPA